MLIKLYSEGKSICRISKETKICRAYISTVLESEGVKKKRSGEEIKKEIKEKLRIVTPIILDMYKHNISITKIHDELQFQGYKICCDTIRRILKENNIRIRTAKFYNKKYECDENVFSEYNKFSCYWAGLLAADGCVYERKDSKNSYIILNLIDENSVCYFKEFLKYTGMIYRRTHTTKFKNSKREYEAETWEVRCLSNQMCEDLKKNFNIGPRKTCTYSPSNSIPKDLVKYFILGYLDGDGSISYYTTNTGRKHFNVTFTGTYETIRYIQNFINKKELNIWQRHPDRKTEIYTLSISGNEQLYSILSILYSDQEINQICMKRKFDKYMLLKKQIEEKRNKASA